MSIQGLNKMKDNKTEYNIRMKEFIEQFIENKAGVFGFIVISFFILIAIFAPYLSPYTPNQIFMDKLSIPPVWSTDGEMQFLFGTDDLGRDVLSRLIYGARFSLVSGIFIVIFSTIAGTILGLFSGYFGGKVDICIMRSIDILMAFPSILLAIIVVSVIGPGLENAVIAISIVNIPSFTRLVRGKVLEIKEKEYVLAAKTFGASPFRIMFKEILPNCSSVLIVQISLGLSEGILSIAALGFLGFGVQAPRPEWGTMLSDARLYIESDPWMVTLPGLCILFVVLGFNLFGDGLRDTLDPKLKR